MSIHFIRASDTSLFFSRGRALARLADQGEQLPHESILGFEDPSDLLKFLTTSRLALFRAIKAEPGSIAAISARLKRDDYAVKRDVDELEKAGLVTIELRSLPGLGSVQEIRVTAQRFLLEAELS
jgi:predicted transcriptional regulator